MRKPAHPAIISVETFTRATLERKKRAGAGNRARSRLERTRPINSGNIYQFRGRVYCDICNRKMQGEILRKAVYYRCRARTLPPGSRSSRSLMVSRSPGPDAGHRGSDGRRPVRCVPSAFRSAQSRGPRQCGISHHPMRVGPKHLR